MRLLEQILALQLSIIPRSFATLGLNSELEFSFDPLVEVEPGTLIILRQVHDAPTITNSILHSISNSFFLPFKGENGRFICNY